MLNSLQHVNTDYKYQKRTDPYTDLHPPVLLSPVFCRLLFVPGTNHPFPTTYYYIAHPMAYGLMSECPAYLHILSVRHGALA